MTTRFDVTPHMVKLQGKDYLPVAARVVWMRQDHPDWSIITEPVTIGESLYMRATVTGDGSILATAHKAVAGRKGPGAAYPVEAAETGAVGRALGLCGYGTLSGDLDEGDEIADAPQAPVNGYAKASGKAAGDPEAVAAVLALLDDAATTEDFEAAKAYAKAGWKRMSAVEQATVTAAVKAAGEVLGRMDMPAPEDIGLISTNN